MNELEKLVAELEAEKTHRAENALYDYTPYPKQIEFHRNGALVGGLGQRLLMAGNQLGKTYSGAFEVAMHLTGLYPDWWEGFRFTGPIKAWVSGETGLAVRDTVQRLLLGEPFPAALGSGALPKDTIQSFSLARGITNLVDTVLVKHVSGGTSILRFKSYEQGREKWQGETIDLLWCDEEPPQALYSEGLTRLIARKGTALMTFTPLKGMSDVVDNFLNHATEKMIVTNMTIYDAAHYTDADRETIIASWPAHERDARARGVPIMGSGRVFTVPEERIYWEPIQVPQHWAQWAAIDFGIDHPFGWVRGAWDRDTDIIYITDAYRVSGVRSQDHVETIRRRGGADLPTAFPQDGHIRDKGSGLPLAKQYAGYGLSMMKQHAVFADGSNSVEAGIMDMEARLHDGRLLVARHLSDWYEEYRLYHRVDGQLIKKKDDLLSATRYLIMTKRYARRGDELGSTGRFKRVNNVARDVNYDIWGFERNGR